VFAGLNLEVGRDFHLYFWVVRPFETGDQWFLNVTQTVTGDQAWLHTPGGGFGGTYPYGISDLLGERLDASFYIEYEIVPEPASVLAIGLGLAGLAQRRAIHSGRRGREQTSDPGR